MVLILVLMEYKNTPMPIILGHLTKRLNPCSNGIQKYKFMRKEIL